ncbi:epithelial membrane protein 3 isoform X2 [Dromaius novaehollandiae]|uniref:epithelial membrane protein 3 isoform X2 n=1 Tax=Dromaius novaehollandiae TaxID=8790 RepID=UPI0031204676
MSFLLFAVSALHVLVLVFLFVATLDKGWWVLPGAGGVNLWFDCVRPNGSSAWACASVADGRAGGGGPAAVQRRLRPLPLAAARGAPREALRRLGGRPAAGRGGGLRGGAAGGAAGGGWQAGRPPGGRFGHCFVLAWLAAPLALASGVTYLRLRKRE